MMRSLIALCIAALCAGCASSPPDIREEFTQSAPRSILVLPPLDEAIEYEIVNSATRVTITGQLVDGVTGDVLWVGAGTASQSSGGGGGLIESMIGAVVNQVATSISDPSRDVGRQASNALLRGRNRAWIAGPYPG